MEFHNLGKHCEFNGCKQLDFLPFNCTKCKHTFCMEHRTFSEHKCEKYDPQSESPKVISCPLCQKPLCSDKGTGEQINSIVEKHISDGCNIEQPNRVLTNRCTKKGCKKSELIQIKCKDCSQQFCISHRNPLDHQCKAKPNIEPFISHGPFRVPIKAK
eukprot:TRINITY_DN7773_c0_g1_i1.p1 TRINITY_DN7773_c0_g1~~TRINITY_DN7773_c0_g1_i1.p1  ORF type:complete len:158 (+),score=29.53 TRINITY_DN7773_c0_g1_i1:241-714(+)